jgi:asparagine synthase (glutamine-hydrolysing)
MTMAHAIESRVPFLDKDLVEFAATLPHNFKLRNFQDKFILRYVAKDYLPKDTAKRKKQRFFVPVHHWFEKDIKSHFFDTFSKQNISNRGYFDYDYIKRIEDKYGNSPLYYGRQMWNLLILDKWFDKFIA